jgi:hypothetical protein
LLGYYPIRSATVAEPFGRVEPDDDGYVLVVKYGPQELSCCLGLGPVQTSRERNRRRYP